MESAHRRQSLYIYSVATVVSALPVARKMPNHEPGRVRGRDPDQVSPPSRREME